MLLFTLAALADVPVTVSFTSLPLPVALKKLSAATGQTLVPSMALQSEVLMLRVDRVPREEVMRRVADMFAAEWSSQPDGSLVLRPEASKVRAREAAILAKSRATLRGSLAYAAKRLREQPERFGPSDAEKLIRRQKADAEARAKAEEAKDYDRVFASGDVEEEKPGWRALARLLPTFDEGKLLAMPPSTRAVWSERPTRLQNAFSPAANAVLQRYREELAVLKPDVDVARVKVVFSRWEHGEAHNAEITAYGPTGLVVDQGSIRMANDSEKLKIPYSQRFAIPPKGNATPMELPPEAIEHAEVLNRREIPSKKRQELLAKWRPILTDPEHHEPTSWLPALGYLHAAKGLNMNLIGSVSELTGLAYDKVKNSETPAQFLAQRQFGATIGKDGWITVENVERLTRVSRARAGLMLRDAIKQGGLSVDSAAAFAAASPDVWPFTNWVGEALTVFFPAQGRRSVLATTGDDRLLRFWHELGPEIRGSLRDGRTIDLHRLPARAQSHLEFMLFHEERLQGVEPTDIFSNGIAGALRMKVVETPIFTSWIAADGETSDVAPVDASLYGTWLAVGNRGRELPAEAYRRRDRFRLGLDRTYRLRFEFVGTEPLEESLVEVFFDPNAAPMDRLPPDLAKAVEAARVKALSQPPKPAISTGGAPPP